MKIVHYPKKIQRLSERGNYPDEFSFEELKSLSSFKKRIEYVNAHLPLLGAGSSRRVYDAGTAVLKVAWNKKGVAQNEIEADVGSLQENLNLVAEVYDYTNDGLFIEQEKSIRKPTSEEVKKFFGGVDPIRALNNLVVVFNGLINPKPRSRTPKDSLDRALKAIEKNERLSQLMNLCENYLLMPNDFVPRNLGIVERGGGSRPPYSLT